MLITIASGISYTALRLFTDMQGGIFGGVAHDDLAFDLLDALAVESDPRTERMLDLMRERGWTGWNRPERLAEPPG
jgi:hypothetical protein